MKKMFSFFEGNIKEAILAPFFKLLEALMDLFVPLVVAYVINEGVGKADNTAIFKAAGLLLLLAILGMAFSFTAQYFAANASVSYAGKLRQALFEHIQTLSYKEIDTLGTDTLITRITSDVNQVQSGLNLALRLLLRSPFIVFGAMIMAFTIDVKSALIFLITIPILSLVVYFIMLKSIPLYTKAQESLDGLSKHTRENLDGVRVIRAFNHEEEEIKEFNARSEAITKINETVGSLSAYMNPLTYAIVNIATIVLIRNGAIYVGNGTLNQGNVVSLYNYMAQIIVELIKLASLTITINRSLACARRINSIFNIETSIKYKDGEPDNDQNEYKVEFNDVSFAYGIEGEDAISDISFKVKNKETIGIIGGTGSGKSTIVNLIPRFYDVNKGEVKVDGIDVRDYPRGQLIKKIGIVPQKAVLFSGTIRENLKWGNENASDEDLYEALRIAQALEVVESKTNKLDEIVEQGGRNFSGGQRQRLTIARALVKKPEILILDDSASALDFMTDYKLRKAISELNMTIFIVSQRSSSVMNCDRIIVMDDGKLVGFDKHEKLLKENKVYQEIYYSQFPKETSDEK